uniref:Inner centromere protein-like n=1 Tax=Nicotiana tabacum TaxID=4097 RepID=A0A1S3Y9L2_TOBAC|nr:PREDICTED: inner centromere protein-like [Nicotiana tabacum]
MSENLETQTVPSIIPTVSSPIETSVLEPTILTPSSPNPKLESQPPTSSSPTQLSTGSHRSRKTSAPKKFVAAISPSVSLEKMVEADTVAKKDNQEISSRPVEECSEMQGVSYNSDESAKTTLGLDLNLAESTSNALLMSSEFTLGLQEQEAIENMLSIAAEGCVVDSTTGELPEGPDPSTQEEHYAPTWDETPYSSKEPQVSTDPAPFPHFYAEPLAIVPPEMRSLSEEKNEGSEEDYDNVALASFIRARSSQETPQESTSKRPITRLQKKEELESVLRKSKKQKKKRRLVKDGKVVNEKVVPPTLVVDVDDEVEEEPGSLVRKSSKKLTLPKSKRESSVSEMDLSKVEGEKSCEKVGEKSGERVVEESGKKVTEELVEQVSEKMVSEKSVEKRKSARQLVKRKASANEEPGSSKKAKVGATQDAGREKLRIQKVLWGHIFAPDILDMSGMRQLVEICEF